MDRAPLLCHTQARRGARLANQAPLDAFYKLTRTSALRPASLIGRSGGSFAAFSEGMTADNVHAAKRRPWLIPDDQERWSNL
jgi:hypothetical protein